jgi:hypothetical protein
VIPASIVAFEIITGKTNREVSGGRLLAEGYGDLNPEFAHPVDPLVSRELAE